MSFNSTSFSLLHSIISLILPINICTIITDFVGIYSDFREQKILQNIIFDNKLNTDLNKIYKEQLIDQEQILIKEFYKISCKPQTNRLHIIYNEDPYYNDWNFN
jgi:hypothetical protein